MFLGLLACLVCTTVKSDKGKRVSSFNFHLVRFVKAFLLIETFILEEKNDNEFEIWQKGFSQIPKTDLRHPGKLHCVFDSPKKLALLSLLKELEGG